MTGHDGIELAANERMTVVGSFALDLNGSARVIKTMFGWMLEGGWLVLEGRGARMLEGKGAGRLEGK